LTYFGARVGCNEGWNSVLFILQVTSVVHSCVPSSSQLVYAALWDKVNRGMLHISNV